MLSIIAIYHNRDILEDYLLKSLKNQNVNYELFLIDNTKGEFQSTAQALNWGAKQVKADSKYLMFVHHDIDLCSNSWLKEAEKILASLPNLGVAGIAGGSERRKKPITSIKHGTPPRLSAQIQIKKPEKVQTVDECLIIVPREIFNKIQFDEKTCDGWHLHAVDYCLSVKKLGFDVYVLPLYAYHLSIGSPAKNYFQALLSFGWPPKDYYPILKKVLKKHKNYYKKIYTTCGTWRVFYPLILQRILPLIMAGIKAIPRRLQNKKNISN